MQVECPYCHWIGNHTECNQDDELPNHLECCKCLRFFEPPKNVRKVKWQGTFAVHKERPDWGVVQIINPTPGTVRNDIHVRIVEGQDIGMDCFWLLENLVPYDRSDSWNGGA